MLRLKKHGSLDNWRIEKEGIFSIRGLWRERSGIDDGDYDRIVVNKKGKMESRMEIDRLGGIDFDRWILKGNVGREGLFV